MDAPCYVPNNPQYGLQLECQWTSGLPQPLQCNGIIQLPTICTDSDLDLLPSSIPQSLSHQLSDPLSPSSTPTGCSANQVGPQTGSAVQGSQHCWTENPSDDMGSFSMPLDLEPLPTLFPFSPCAATIYKTESNCSPTLPPHGKEKPVHDMADVLLSLKHAVVHPGQAAEAAYHHHQQQQQQQQLSYTVHPHQMLMSPNGYTYCEQIPTSGYQTTHHPNNGISAPINQTAPPPMFPSMSVNVSMNMTYHPSTMPGYEQVQWATTPQSPPYVQNHQGLLSPSYAGGATYSFTADFRPPQDVPLITGSSFKPVLNPKAQFSPVQWATTPQSPPYVQNHQGLLSPSYAGGATYSFTADFRPPQDVPLITGSSFKPVLNPKAQFSPVRSTKNHKMEFLSPGKVQMVCGDDDSQRPNLCRICGKTYARPSTLKTHLRTHSGEKPYRCIDCNKSFSQAANLTAHVRTHSGEKPFRCPICDRRFSQSSSVTTHMRTHSGERPYRCRMCKKAFSDSSTLTKHLRIHSGEKPYQCKLCLLRFSQSGNLNRHMRVHGTNNAMLV